MQRYPKYKSSNVNWLGDVPEHWIVENSKWLFELRNERARLSDEQLTASQKYGMISQKRFMELENQKVMQVLKNPEILKHIEAGDFVISMRSFQGGLEYSHIDGAVSSAYVALIPRPDLIHDFYRYLFKSPLYIQALQSTSNLVRDGQALRYNNFIQVRIPLPPPNEQFAIARFLEREICRIDALISEKQNFINLLEEKRQALISHVVTKGLDDSVEMKDSGVEWIGEVPEHWKMPKLFHITSRIGDGLHGTPEYVENSGIYFVNGNNLKNGRIIFGEKTKQVTQEIFMQHRISLDDKSVLVSINGTIGSVARYNNEKIMLGKSAAYINCKTAYLLPDFLIWAFQSIYAKTYFDLEVTGTTIANLSLKSIRDFKIAIPPKQEQLKLAQYLTEESNQIEQLVEKVNNSISLLKEHRSALISEAVTGKIDVREEV